MEKLKFKRKNYSIEFSEAGRVLFLADGRRESAPWNAIPEEYGFGVPFINGTQEKENAVACSAVKCTENEVEFQSPSGATGTLWEMGEKFIHLRYSNVPDCGPRMGLKMDLNLLDLNTGSNWQEQCMPTTIYTDPDYEYAYFIFTTSDGRYMTLCVNGPLAAWRIKYSYEGHRMTGFQVLSQADDVRCDGKKMLPVVDSLDLVIGFPGSIGEAFREISETLGICIAMPKVSGGFSGSKIPYTLFGKAEEIRVEDPSGTEIGANNGEIALEDLGEYAVITRSENGRQHRSSVLCQEEWEPMFDKVNRFYARYFQHECGAFSRVIWKNTLSPKDGLTFEGVEFGDPEQLMSCRTGEFGGFSAWAMIKNCLLFGEKPDLMSSIDRYINHWALNRDGGRVAYNGAICTQPTEFLGRKYSAYHLYHEVNYPQHELFLMEQFADYYFLTREKRMAEDLKNLVMHFIGDHMDERGSVLCQNTPEGEAVDYSTVHIALAGLLCALKVLRQEGMKEQDEVYRACVKLADHVCARGLGFPTEGEPCTEDGSMACTVVTLLLAYSELQAKPEYLAKAKEILDAHKMLEMVSGDCRMNGSSIRFWETQYESRDWGPSINAGHAWTIWTAEAKARLAVLSGDFDLLRESYNGFVTNFRKIESSGAMPSCYTPDMIPGTPHAHSSYGNNKQSLGLFWDMRPTTTHLAMNYVEKTYAVSGNYSLIKAGELLSHISGISKEQEICVNGIWKDGAFYSKAPKFDTLVAEPFSSGSLRISCESPIKIYCKKPLKVEKGELVATGDLFLEVMPQDHEVVVSNA